MILTEILVACIWKEIKKEEYIFIPFSKLEGGLMVCQSKFYKTSNDSYKLGEMFKKCIEDHKHTPFIEKNFPTFYEVTGIKSNNKRQKNYSLVIADFYTVDNVYRLTPCKKSEGNFLGTYDIEPIPKNATSEEIGELIKKTFEMSD